MCVCVFMNVCVGGRGLRVNAYKSMVKLRRVKVIFPIYDIAKNNNNNKFDMLKQNTNLMSRDSYSLKEMQFLTDIMIII